MPNAYVQPFAENVFYHVYCKAVGDSVLFRDDENRYYFLQQYQKYLQPYVETYCYTMLNNHVHWLVKPRSLNDINRMLTTGETAVLKRHQEQMLSGYLGYNAAFEMQFRDYFIGYAKAYNKMYNRSGALFMTPFRRLIVKDDAHFSHLCIYIHANVRKHRVLNDFENYPWSSYRHLLADGDTWLMRKEVLDWFGGKEQFVKCHKAQADHYFGEGERLEDR